MTIKEFWEKYNRCPQCTEYIRQKTCDGCIHRIKGHGWIDKFRPTDECMRMLEKCDP